jgi:hypothetical protein
LVFVERHEESKNKNNRLGTRHLGLWARDYIELLKPYVPRENITITKITGNIWEDPGWQKSGAFIRVIISGQ